MELNNYTDYGKEALLKTEEALADIKNLYNQMSKIKVEVSKKWGLPLGCVFANAGLYMGDNAIKLDGRVVSSADYPEFYNYIIANKAEISTCTNEEFNAEISTSGYCEKFVIDEDLATIRIPLASGFSSLVGMFSPLYIVVKCNED